MSDTDGPNSTDLTRLVHEALNQRPSWLTRLRELFTRLRSRAATMGGYWGGVTMRWRNKK